MQFLKIIEELLFRIINWYWKLLLFLLLFFEKPQITDCCSFWTFHAEHMYRMGVLVRGSTKLFCPSFSTLFCLGDIFKKNHHWPERKNTKQVCSSFGFSLRWSNMVDICMCRSFRLPSRARAEGGGNSLSARARIDSEADGLSSIYAFVVVLLLLLLLLLLNKLLLVYFIFLTK